MTHYNRLVHTYYCNGRSNDGGICIGSFELEGTAKDVWRQAREDGWKQHGEGHLCPHHATNLEPHDSVHATEQCAGCKGPIVLAELTENDNLPLCTRHWSQWIARFLNSDDAPGCRAHLILESHDSETGQSA